MYQLKKSFTISCSHYLNNKETDKETNQKIYGRCCACHGHNYKVTVYLQSITNKQTGMLMNFTEIKDIFKRYIDDVFDHQLLNTVPPFDKVIPTAENMAKTFYLILKVYIPLLYGIEVEETDGASAMYFEDEK